MNYVKLQLGCLVLSVFVTALYIRGTTGPNAKCNRYYDFLMALCTNGILFDGITAWTVNHQDIVPPYLNLIFHALFYVIMDLTMFVAFLYMFSKTMGEVKNRLLHILVCIPLLVSLIVIFVFLKDVYYVEGAITSYSMGISVISTYACCILYFGTMLIIALVRIRNIESTKRVGIFSILGGTFIVLIAQIIFPEILITSIMPAILLIGFYITMEDPSLIRLKDFNGTMVTGFATLVEENDSNTGGHIYRTKTYVTVLLEKMKKEHAYKKILTKDFIDNMITAAPMHDIGKISTPESILQKPGKLTDEEYEIMKKHAPEGGKIIKETFGKIDAPEFLQTAYEVAMYHHEKWNGRGYPEGLKENQIPLCARIMAIADVFDAVSAKRCYRDALPLDVCFKIMEEGSGKDFDPELTRLFLSAKDEIISIYNSTKQQ